MNDNDNQQHTHGAGDHHFKPSDIFAAAGVANVAATGMTYEQRREMDDPPRGHGADGSVEARNFTKPSDVIQTQYEGDGHGATDVGGAFANGTSNGAPNYNQERPGARDHAFGANAGVGTTVGPGHPDQAMGAAASSPRDVRHAFGGPARRAQDQSAFDAENNLPVDGHATGVNVQGGAAPLASSPGMGTIASGHGTANVVMGTIQQAAGTLLNNDNMIAKGLERESKGIAARDPAQAQALQREADIARSQNRH